ncbi:MAG TPA: hypothetical protein ENK46_03710, partial [Flavobacteriia bacterium]|nr:hypothetical protein [Flavobacteriia bacterium]
KFDILLQLLTKDVVFDKIDLSRDLVLTQFIKDNFIEVLSPFLNFIPAVGGSLSKVMDKLLKLKTKYDAFESELKSDELKRATAFLDEFTKIKGSIYEEDFYTNLIQGLITQLKEKEKELILVIDDLDRIDPEHIFRLLNVFAAQVDVNPKDEQENKFGFDKVIFVCDIDNIRNIYKHKYGIETDFNGYIDKFYSRELFEFNAQNIINNYVEQILISIKAPISNTTFNVFIIKTDFDFKRTLKLVLKTMLFYSAINMRDLFRVYNRSDLELPEYNLELFGYSNIYNSELDVILLFDFLKIIFGNNIDKVLLALKKCKLSKGITNKSYLNRMIANTLLVLDMKKHQFKRFKPNNREDNIKYSFENLSYEINKDYGLNREMFFANLVGNVDEFEIDYFNLLYRSFVLINQTIK